MKVKINSKDSAFDGWTGTIIKNAGNSHEWVLLDIPDLMPEWLEIDSFDWPLVFRKDELEITDDR